MNKIKILLADDHQMVLEGLEAVLRKDEDIEVVGTALDGIHAMAILERSAVDVAVLDISMPRMDGLQALEEIKRKYPNVKVLALTMHKDSKNIKSMVNAGAVGYILKNRGGKDLVEGIKTVMKGQTYWGAEVAKTFMNSMLSENNQRNQDEVQITEMERQVLELVADGMTTKEIADKLCRAPSTIDTHKTNLKKKLSLRNEKLLVRFAVEHGYVKKP